MIRTMTVAAALAAASTAAPAALILNVDRVEVAPSDADQSVSLDVYLNKAAQKAGFPLKSIHRKPTQTRNGFITAAVSVNGKVSETLGNPRHLASTPSRCSGNMIQLERLQIGSRRPASSRLLKIVAMKPTGLPPE